MNFRATEISVTTDFAQVQPSRTHALSASGYVPTARFGAELIRDNNACFPILPLKPGLSTAKVFRECVNSARQSHGAIGNCLHLYSEIEYAQMRLFVDHSGLCGFALSGSELVSVFSHRFRSPKGVMRNLVGLAIQLGGVRLNAFDTVLPSLYSRSGFFSVARLPWSDSQAPDGWDYNCATNWNHGRPDVLFMVFGCQGGKERLVNSFDEGLHAQFEALDANCIDPTTESDLQVFREPLLSLRVPSIYELGAAGISRSFELISHRPQPGGAK